MILHRSPQSDYSNLFKGISYHSDVNSASLASGSTKVIAFATPIPSTRIIIAAIANSTGEGLLEILKAPTITSGSGSQLAIFNKNHNSSNTSSVYDFTATPVQNKATEDPTITDDGTIVSSVRIGPYKDMRSLTNLNRIVLAQNTAYAFRLTSLSASNVVNLILNWDEV